MNDQTYTPLSDPLVANVVEKLNTDLREEFEERAGILEHDGKLARAHAECLALLDLLIRHPYCLTGLTAIEVELDGASQWVLTSNLSAVRQHLIDIGGCEIAVLDPVDVVQQQYSDIALLTTFA